MIHVPKMWTWRVTRGLQIPCKPPDLLPQGLRHLRGMMPKTKQGSRKQSGPCVPLPPKP